MRRKAILLTPVIKGEHLDLRYWEDETATVGQEVPLLIDDLIGEVPREEQRVARSAGCEGGRVHDGDADTSRGLERRLRPICGCRCAGFEPSPC